MRTRRCCPRLRRDQYFLFEIQDTTETFQNFHETEKNKTKTFDSGPETEKNKTETFDSGPETETFRTETETFFETHL